MPVRTPVGAGRKALGTEKLVEEHPVPIGYFLDNRRTTLHFIEDVKLFKQNNPDKLFIYEAQKQRLLMKKVKKIFSDGIIKFLDYMIELKQNNPTLFYYLLTDYEMSSQKYVSMNEKQKSENNLVGVAYNERSK